jgi:hypothetical protein
MRRLALLSIGVGLPACASPMPESLDEVARQAITDTVRAESQRMIATMRTRQVDSVLLFYGKNAAYVGNGEIGDWRAIVAGAPPRYASYTRVECAWGEPFRIDVLSRTVAVVTAMFRCEKADTSGATWVENVARTAVLSPEDGRWRIVAVHESIKPGDGGLR